MPMYAYQCRSCESTFEVKQSFSDTPLTDCLVCETPNAVFRVIQPAGVVFKGSGWYVTDSRGSRDSLTSATGKNGKETKESPSTETAPASKPEASGTSEGTSTSDSSPQKMSA